MATGAHLCNFSAWNERLRAVPFPLQSEQVSRGDVVQLSR